MNATVTRTQLVAVAIIGALIGLWISPGRAYAEPEHDSPTASRSAIWPACEYEDGSGQRRCVWDGRHMGNGSGASWKIVHGGEDDARYVRITHKRAHRLAYGS